MNDIIYISDDEESIDRGYFTAPSSPVHVTETFISLTIDDSKGTSSNPIDCDAEPDVVLKAQSKSDEVNVRRTKMVSPFDRYTHDFENVDLLKVNESTSWAAFSKEWLHLKRTEFFKTVGRRHEPVCVECRTMIKEVDIRLCPYSTIKRNKGPLCYLCISLYNQFHCLDEEIEAIHYLLYGEINPLEKASRNIGINELLNIFKSRCERIVDRGIRKNSDANALGANELLKLAGECNMQCAITQAPLYLHSRSKYRVPYWALSIDHIVPISRAAKMTGYGSVVENMQLTCHAINMIKSTYTNSEIIAWWKAFREAKIQA